MAGKIFELLPTKAHWHKWTLPSKLTAVSVFLGIIAILLATS